MSNNTDHSIKRVLWVDDRPDIEANELFPACETTIVSTMDEAIVELSSDRIYHYDTIVFDINFENGLPNGAKNVVDKLKKLIHLNPEEQDKAYLLRFGGYLLYVYLLERGYPSEQIAFLTGQQYVVDELTEVHQLSKEEFYDEIIAAWEKTGIDDLDAFEKRVEKLNIAQEFKNDPMEYASLLDGGKKNEVKKLIDKIASEYEQKRSSEPFAFVNDSGDKLRDRFHKANLKLPAFFTKDNNDYIDEKYRYSAAKQWITDHKTSDKVTRWLILDISDHIDKLFNRNKDQMKEQICSLFRDWTEDCGIQSAIKQMYFVFDGLRSEPNRGAYFQAISAMLVPYEADLKETTQTDDVSADLDIRRKFAVFAKQARNYCMHNQFGTTFSDNETAIFIIMGTVSAILTKEQRGVKNEWFGFAEQFINEHFKGKECSLQDNIEKVNRLYSGMYHSGHLHRKGYMDREGDILIHDSDDSDDPPQQFLNAFGWNKITEYTNEDDKGTREKYYRFTLAAYVVKCFQNQDVSTVLREYGESIASVYRVSHLIVADYSYPYPLEHA